MPPKPVYKTAVPFSETKWPDISASSQTAILDLLCNLLEPIGRHRENHIEPSKGKTRSRKRKRAIKDAGTETDPAPPAPELSKHILVGLNSVTRHLSAFAAKTAPPSAPAAQEEETTDEGDRTEEKGTETETATETNTDTPLRPLSVLILPHPMPSSSLAHAHLPTLVYLSTTKASQPTRLVTLPTSSEARLASTLHIPRVGALGIMEGAPGVDGLVEYICEHVGAVECKWIEESLKPEWRGVKIAVAGQTA